MITKVEAVENRANNGTKTSAGFKEHVRGNNESHSPDSDKYTVEGFARQKEFILKSMNEKAEKVMKLGEHILKVEKPDLKDGKHVADGERFQGDLKAISLANIRLFVELNAYTNFLTDAKKGVETQFPDVDNASRIEIEKSIDELLKEIKDVAKESNGIMKAIGEKKGMKLGTLSISASDIKSLNTDIKSIKDENGNSVAARLGSNLVRFAGAVPPTSVQDAIINDQKEIEDRLSEQSKALLGRVSLVGGKMFSIDIIRQLTIIDVQLNESNVQKRTDSYQKSEDEEITMQFSSENATEDSPHKREREAPAYGNGSKKHKSIDTVRLLRSGMVEVTEPTDSNNAVSSSQKPEIVVAARTGIMPTLTKEEIMPLSELLRMADEMKADEIKKANEMKVNEIRAEVKAENDIKTESSISAETTVNEVSTEAKNDVKTAVKAENTMETENSIKANEMTVNQVRAEVKAENTMETGVKADNNMKVEQNFEQDMSL
jgi:hypothetical protein